MFDHSSRTGTRKHIDELNENIYSEGKQRDKKLKTESHDQLSGRSPAVVPLPLWLHLRESHRSSTLVFLPSIPFLQSPTPPGIPGNLHST